MSVSPYGLVPLPLWGYLLVTFLTVQSMFFGVTLYLHRDQSHGGLILHPLLRHLFRFWLWFSSGVVTREWVAVHRCHHAHADQVGDPHSPRRFGLRRVLFEGAELYRAATRDAALLHAYGRGTPADWLERRLYSGRPYLGVALFVAAHLALFGVAGIIMIAVHLSAMPFFAAGVINGLGHAVGYRSFEMPSTATNLVPWAVLLGGEELHNNHHAFPRSACFAVQPWELDVGWCWIRLFKALGLARVRWRAPRPRFERRHRELDAETLHALFTNRLHVLRAYTRSVVRPVCRELARREGPASPRAPNPQLLIRHPALLAEEARLRLRQLLDEHEVLRGVVEYRDSLQQLWNEASANPARALLQLREWCRRAEGSGIEALRNFARALPAYAR